jgi:hypothetical protein
VTIPLEFDVPGQKLGWDTIKEEKWIERHYDKPNIGIREDE